MWRSLLGRKKNQAHKLAAPFGGVPQEKKGKTEQYAQQEAATQCQFVRSQCQTWLLDFGNRRQGWRWVGGKRNKLRVHIAIMPKIDNTVFADEAAFERAWQKEKGFQRRYKKASWWRRWTLDPLGQRQRRYHVYGYYKALQLFHTIPLPFRSALTPPDNEAQTKWEKLAAHIQALGWPGARQRQYVMQQMFSIFWTSKRAATAEIATFRREMQQIRTDYRQLLFAGDLDSEEDFEAIKHSIQVRLENLRQQWIVN